MSARVSFCWSPLAQWFERGPGIDPLCASYMDVVSDGDHSARLNTSASDHQRYMLEHGRNILREEGYEIVSLLREDDGVLEIGLEEVEPVYNRETRELDEYRRWIRERDPLLLGDHETRDQKLALAIQSSSTSYDQLKPSCRRVDDLSVASSAPTLILQYPSASLGHAITAGDFTGDGIPRLAISAPYYTTSPYSPHSGVVFILPSLNYTVAGTIDILTLASYVLTPPTIVSAAAAQSRFGWSMVIVDLNHDGIDDLAVAAPFAGGDRGSVYVYFGRKGEGLSKQPDVVIEGEGPGVVEGFGTVLVGADVDGDGFADLIVACPLCGGEEGVKHVGFVLIYAIEYKLPVLLPNSYFLSRLPTEWYYPPLSHYPQLYHNSASPYPCRPHLLQPRSKALRALWLSHRDRRPPRSWPAYPCGCARIRHVRGTGCWESVRLQGAGGGREGGGRKGP